LLRNPQGKNKLRFNLSLFVNFAAPKGLVVRGLIMKKTWGGRFNKKTDPQVEAFTESISFDHRLGPFDIEASQAHVQTLVKAKLLTPAEGKQLSKGLAKIGKLLAQKKLPLNEGMEDIHTAIEQALIKMVGPLGGKIHTGRSRNDQVATDFRLYLRSAIREVIQSGLLLMGVLTRLAGQEKKTLMPGYTHLQRAMPVTLGHYLAAYGFMFARDMERFIAAWQRADSLPLGVGALAGTNHAFDRNLTARILKLKAPVPNSLDAVSDRDAYVDFLAAAAVTQMHLSRLAEDLVLWASAEFGYIEMDDAYATGSSLMPQKKNPDVPELVRGKTGRVFGNLMGLLTVLKGLPLSYNRDLQEDKRFVFDSTDTVTASLKVTAGFLKTLRFKRDIMEKAVEGDKTILATDLADVLVKKDFPFRKAHEVVGKIVSYCLAHGKRLQDLTDSELGKFSNLFPKGTAQGLSVKKSVLQKKAMGGTSPDNVTKQVALLNKNISWILKKLPKTR
jgi:argininosuccinate lyase